MQNEDFQIHPKTHIVHMELQVADLANMLAFYANLMGFQLISNQNGIAKLSPTGQTPTLLTLTEHKGARKQPLFSTGLYHTAYRFPNRAALATSLLRIVAASWPLQGASDHLVSEAIYLADPEGNGIELYRDRPREQWPQMNGMIQMDTQPLDLGKLLKEADQDAAQKSEIDRRTDIGHVHLQVSALAETKAFYHDLIGLDIVATMRSALFLSAGGYHHHLGANIWNSRHAPRRTEDMTGLRSYSFLIPDEGGWLALFERLQDSGKRLQAAERDGRPGVRLDDQDNNCIELLGPSKEAVTKAIKQQ